MGMRSRWRSGVWAAGTRWSAMNRCGGRITRWRSSSRRAGCRFQTRWGLSTRTDELRANRSTARVRPILQQRHHAHAERALANVDLFLDLARPYAVRGLAAFAEAMME